MVQMVMMNEENKPGDVEVIEGGGRAALPSPVLLGGGRLTPQ
jgi:hypothetical protein